MYDTQTIALNPSCPTCGCTQGRIKEGSGPHAGKLECSDCQRWMKWLSKRQLAALRMGGES